MASEQGKAQHGNRGWWPRVVVWRCFANGGADVSLLEKSTDEGDSPVCHLLSSMHGVLSMSHVPWAWSANVVVIFTQS